MFDIIQALTCTLLVLTVAIDPLTCSSSVDQFPLLTTKKVFWRGILEELLWFIKVRLTILSLF